MIAVQVFFIGLSTQKIIQISNLKIKLLIDQKIIAQFLVLDDSFP
jgi:hypothetical protein